MMLKKLGALSIIKLANLMLMVVFNFILLRYFSIGEIGRYYLMATVAYIGNALIFVGADVHLQGLLADLPKRKALDKVGILRYMGYTSLIGLLLAFSLGSLYYIYYDQNVSWFVFSMVATINCATIYFGSVVRNLCQNTGFAYLSMLEFLLENAIKSIGIVLIVYFDEKSGLMLMLVTTGGMLLSALAFWWLFFSSIENIRNASYVKSLLGSMEKLLSVGLSGTLSWGQLQAYRLIGGAGQKQIEAVGAISFLTTLGQAGAAAGFTILDQFQKTKLYQSNGGSFNSYLKYATILAIILATISFPAAVVFVQLARKEELLAFVYLVPLGVALEYGNNVFGLCMHYLNVRQKRFAVLVFPSVLAFVVVMLIMFSPISSDFEIHTKIATALLIGQILVAIIPVLTVWRMR